LVLRKRRNEVEDEQQHIHGGEPLRDDDHERRSADLHQEPRGSDEDDGQRRRHGWSDRRDQHLGPCVEPVTAHLSDATEEPQLDALDGHATPPRKQRMSHLMGCQRNDQE
jgi:hypothetical protein